MLLINLPDRDGLQILSPRARDRHHCPGADGARHLTIAHPDGGADDYLVKPFAFAELLARIRALLRRGRTVNAFHYAVADLEMDLVAQHVTRRGRSVELTVREFELLEYLLRYERQAVSREALRRSVWKEQGASTTLDNVIDVHIARLRKKIDLDQPIVDTHRPRHRLHAA